MNHTPGWTVQQLEDAHNGYADWPTFAIRDNTTNVCLALVGTVDHYDSAHNAERASLIAAAPELLEALKNLLCEPMAERTVDAAKRAVAKATGHNTWSTHDEGKEA